MSEKAYVFLGICCLVIVILNLLHVYQSNELATKGPELEELQIQIKDMDIQNQKLRVELLQAKSYQVIATEAAALGLTKHRSYLYLWK